MTDRPIIFSAPMVRALLAGRKTMTRRVTKKQDWPERIVKRWPNQHSTGYEVGDLLWVREAWGHDGPDLDSVRRGIESDGQNYGPYYFADARWFDNATIKKRSPIFMPRWASRITLTVTAVKVERLQDITEEDAKSEGAFPEFEIDVATFVHGKNYDFKRASTHRLGFKHLWSEIHGRESWGANPWIVAITFERALA